MSTIHRFVFGPLPAKTSVTTFRGAFVKAMGDRASLLMHNHSSEGLRYAYPLVQYKYVDGSPTIVAFDKMGDEIADFLKDGGTKLRLARKTVGLDLRSHEQTEYEPVTEDAPKYYSLTSWLPLTDKKDKRYASLMALTDRVCLLESVLVGNVLSFLKGLDYHAEEQLFCVVSDILKEYRVDYKDATFKAFDIHFVSNILLPDLIGLGKSASVGMGLLRREDLPQTFLNAPDI